MLSTDLRKYCEKVLVLFDEHIKKTGNKPKKRTCIKHYCTDLKITETSSSSSHSTGIIEEDDYSYQINGFISGLKETLEFNDLVQLSSRRYKDNILKIYEKVNPEIQLSFWLESFIQRLLYERLKGNLTTDKLIEYTALFQSEMELSPHEYKYTHYLQGLFLDGMDLVKINDDITIRKTQKDDLEYTSDIFSDLRSKPSHLLPSSIMEVSIVAKDERDCQSYIETIFNALRLYKLSSIYSIGHIQHTNSVIWPMSSHSSFGNTRYSMFKVYTIKSSEISEFTAFVNTMLDRLNFNKEDKKHRSLSISLERFNSSLLEATPIDRKLMTAVMGLESIFTFEKDRGENAFKLGLRIARLFSHLTSDAQKIRESIEASYSFRNKVVHGSYVSQEDKNKMNELFPDILNYLRVSLVFFLLNQDIGKDKIVELIDKSLISSIDTEELKKTIDRNSITLKGIPSTT